MTHRHRASNRLRAALVVAVIARSALAGAEADTKSEPSAPKSPPIGNAGAPAADPGIAIAHPSWSMKSLAPNSEREFENALANTKAKRDSAERMAAMLAGETSLFEASRLTGQERIDSLERAARNGDAAAASELGDLLDTGEFMRPDPVRSAGYYRAGAMGGRMDAAHNLGTAYARGHGVPRDYYEALAWLTVARRRGDDSGVDEQLRQHLLEQQHPTIVTAAAERARELQAKRPREEIIAALPPAAPLVYEPETSSPDGAGEAVLPADAPPGTPPVVVITITGTRLAWPTLEELQRAANRGDVTAMDALGRVLVAGKLLPADPLRALMWFERSAAAGDVDAAYQLGGLYSDGEGIVHDDAKAFSYFLQAARGGSVIATANVGVYLTNGRGTKPDPVNGLAWLIVAKHYGIDRGQEGRLRAYLARQRPADVAKAEATSAELLREIEARIH